MRKILLICAALAFLPALSQQKGGIKIVESKKIELTSELSPEQISRYNGLFLKFVAALKAEDRDAVKGLISDKVKTVVNDDVLRVLSGGISFTRKTEVYRSGLQKLLDNETYPAIQYKYADDPQDPPRDVITVIFENNGKIMGVKPDYRE